MWTKIVAVNTTSKKWKCAMGKYTAYCTQCETLSFLNIQCRKLAEERLERKNAETNALAAQNARLRKALHDAIAAPMGVVPDSAVRFYEPEKFYKKQVVNNDK